MDETYKSHVELAEAVRAAHYGHRQIVPLIGAGLSADSGFPVVASIVRYLAKLQLLVKKLPGGFDESMRTYLEARFRHPVKYIKDFGWPDRYALNQDLFLMNKKANEKKTITQQVAEQLDETARRLSAKSWNYDELIKETLKAAKSTKDPNTIIDQLKITYSKSTRWEIIGDWRRIIQHVTDYQSDISDSLISSLGRDKQPNQGHRFLAFLARRLSIRTIFTFNFDDLIEQALEIERYRPKVFSMEQGSDLPPRTLVDDVISVIKMHGSTHALLLDERLDRPLSEDYLDRFTQIAGSNPLLLVIGCSAGDYRLHSLVRHILEKPKRGTEKEIRVAWLQYGKHLPVPMLKDPLKEDSGLHECGVVAYTQDVQSSLTHLYSQLSSRYPASRERYSTRPERMSKYPELKSAGGPSDQFSQELDAFFEGGSKFGWITTDQLLFHEPGTGEVVPTGVPAVTASELILEVVRKAQSVGFNTINISLEIVHTLAGVVGWILDQCRKYDNKLAPSVLPTDELDPGTDSNEFVAKAVAVVVYALQRSRYLLVLDGLEAYLWSTMSHHGEVTIDDTKMKRFKLLCDFIKALKARIADCCESKILLGIDQREPRHLLGQGSAILELDREYYSDLKEVILSTEKHPTMVFGLSRLRDFEIWTIPHTLSNILQSETCSTGQVTDFITMAFLATSRRVRQLSHLRQALSPFFKSKHDLEATLDRCIALPELGLIRIEGGGLWMNRVIRNRIYKDLSSHVTTEMIRRLFSPVIKDDSIQPLSEQEELLCLVQCVMLYGIHQQMARSYYVYIFGQSHDVHSFLEYTYHRISSLRYLTKFIAILKGYMSRPLAQDNCLDQKAFTKIRTLLTRLIGCTEEEDKEHFRIRYNELRRGLHIRTKTLFSRALDKWPHSESEKTAGNGQGMLEKDFRIAWRDFRQELVKELEQRHKIELQALNRSWQRHDQVLRLQISAQHLLLWTTQLVNDDLRYRLNDVVIGYGNRNEVKQLSFSTGRKVVASQHIDDFIKTLQSLQVKIWTERADYLRVLDLRANQLKLNIDLHQDVKGLNRLLDFVHAIRVEEIRYLPRRAELLHAAIDIANVLVKRAQAHPFPDDHDFQMRDRWLNKARLILDNVEKALLQLPETITPEQVSLCNEALLRTYYLYAESQWKSLSLFRARPDDFIFKMPLPGEIFDGQTSSERQQALRQGLAWIDLGLEENRKQLHGTTRSPISVFLDRAGDGSLYSQYRTAYDSLRARVRWQLDLLIFREQLASKSGADQMVFATQLREFQERSFRYFELARSGQDDNNPLLGAIAEIYMAEACLGISLFQRNMSKHFGEKADAMPIYLEALSKLEAARGCLQRAARLLSHSRRNAVWWRLYFSMVAQYQFERLDAIDKQPAGTQKKESPERTEFPELLQRIRRGYNAVANAALYRTDFVTDKSWLYQIAKLITQTSHKLIGEYLDQLNNRLDAVGKARACSDTSTTTRAIIEMLHHWERLDDANAVGEAFQLDRLL